MSGVFRSERMGYTRCQVCGAEIRVGKLAECSHARKHVREGKVVEGNTGRPYFNVTFDIVSTPAGFAANEESRPQ